MTMPDEASIAALYERHYLALVRLAVHLVDDLESAEDVVQDVFAGARALPAEPDAALRYLRTAVVNRSRSLLRRRRVFRAFAARPVAVEDAEGADAGSLLAERRRSILAAIATLPQRQREVVVLRYYEDLSVAEIAALLRVRPGAVSSALARALQTLTVRLGADHEH